MTVRDHADKIASTEPKERSVIVTGASGGLGQSIVRHLLSRQCQVAALDLDFPQWEVPSRSRLSTHKVDMASSISVTQATQAAIQTMGHCDSVISAAAIIDNLHRAEHFSESSWNHEMSVNLNGAFRLAQETFLTLRDAEDSRIIFVSSTAGVYGQVAQAAYAASKAGLIGLTKTLAAEWATHGICVNAVVPGMIDTPKVALLPEALRSKLKDNTALGRFSTTSEVAGTIAFLLSPAAASITGTTLQIDGGFLLNSVVLSGSSH